MITLTDEQLDHLAGVACAAWRLGRDLVWRDVVRAVVDAINAQPSPLSPVAYEMTDEQFAEFKVAFDAAMTRRRFREGSDPS